MTHIRPRTDKMSLTIANAPRVKVILWSCIISTYVSKLSNCFRLSEPLQKTTELLTGFLGEQIKAKKVLSMDDRGSSNTGAVGTFAPVNFQQRPD